MAAGSARPMLDSTWWPRGRCSTRARDRRFRAELATDDPRADALDWERGRAWALQQAMGLVWYYRETNPAMHTLGMTTIERLLG